MKKFIKEYKNENVDRINYDLINRNNDYELVEYIIDCCKSLEVLKYIKFLGYEYITNEAEINTSEYIDARSRGKVKKKEQTRYMYLNDSRYAELRLKFHLECDDEEDTIVKKILIPVPDERGYYTIKGTQYFLMYQIVDTSTYTTKSTLTLKSMMPVILKMKMMKYEDIDGTEYSAPTYTINIFKKDADILLFYMAKMGADSTLQYFSVDKVIRFTQTIDDRKNNIYFPISSKMFLEVNRYFFDKYVYTRTIAFMLLNIVTNRLTFESLYSEQHWIESIGSLGTTTKTSQYEKGLNTLTFFDRMIDDTTKRILKIHQINKQDTYSILRWMVMNFNSLRKKDNLDLNNKRLRCNEYIASLLTKAFSERVNRIIALGSKATLKNIKEIFKFPGDILIQQLHKSGLLRFDDKVNDMDFFAKLRLTFKGPNSLGGNNENNIAAKYRGIDPSYIGKIDINVCGTSDPGTSAVLTPFCKTDGLYFNGSNDPEDFKYIYDKDIVDTFKKDSEVTVTPTFKSVEEYFNYHLSTIDVNKNFKIYESDNMDNYMVIDINLDEDDE